MNPNFPYPYIGNAVLPQSLQQTQVTSSVTPMAVPQVQQQPATTQQNWTWKATHDYQSMLREPIPFDGTPTLFMLENEPLFYIVQMTDTGRKVINGYSFTPLDVPQPVQSQPVQPQQTEQQRLDRLETQLSAVVEHLNTLLTEVHKNEPNHENAAIQRQPITA